MKLSLCVVNYRSLGQIKEFLESVSDYRPNCLFEVIVVNNSPKKDDLFDLKSAFGDWVRVINSPKNVGFGSAHNRAVKSAKGEYVMICNPDIVFLSNDLEKLLEFAETQDSVGIVGPRLVDSTGAVQSSCRKFPRFSDLIVNRLGLSSLFPKRKQKYLIQCHLMKEPKQVDWLVGAVMLMKRERFLEIGGFDEQFFLFFEDTDLCRRMKEAAYEVWYYPNVSFLHSSRRLSKRGFWPFKKVFWIHLSSAAKYFMKWRRR